MQAQNTFQNQNAEKTDDSMVKLQKAEILSNL